MCSVGSYAQAPCPFETGSLTGLGLTSEAGLASHGPPKTFFPLSFPVVDVQVDMDRPDFLLPLCSLLWRLGPHIWNTSALLTGTL